MLGVACIPFLAPLAEGQQAIVMVLCQLCVCPPVRKICLQKTSQKLLTGFLPNFTGMSVVLFQIPSNSCIP